MKKYRTIFTARMLITLLVTLFCAVPVFAAVTPPTDAEYQNMVKRGKNYLLSKQTPAVFTNVSGAGSVYQSGGYWNDNINGYHVASTGMSVAALLDTGVPKTDRRIIDGIAFLRNEAKLASPSAAAADLGKGGIGGYPNTYQNGITIMALYYYDDPADVTLVKNLAEIFIANQGTAANSFAKEGGWNYSTNGGGDLSNTQFGVMGLYYANSFLQKHGSSLSTDAWKDKVFGYLQRTQIVNPADKAYDGAFSYGPGDTGSFVGGSMTGAGLWSLGLIGKQSDTLGTPKGTAMGTAGVNWFANNYRWDANPGPSYFGSAQAYYYFIFGMAKGLTIVQGQNNKIGAHDWVNGVATVNGETADGLKYTMFLKRDSSLEKTTDPSVDITNQTFWYGSGGLDGGDILATSWVLMSLGMADASVAAPEKILAPVVVDIVTQPTLEVPPIAGNVVIKAELGQLIEQVKDKNNNPLPFREAIVKDQKQPASVLPVGAMNFQLINVAVGGTATIRINVPEEAMNELHANFDERKAFVDKKGKKKFNISWYKIINGIWRPLAGVPIDIDKAAHVLIVTLKDGGPEDHDGVANGVIADPGAPGFNSVSASPVGATYTSAQNVTLTSDVDTKKIYYTMGGADPTTASTQYTTAINISANTTLKFFATDADGTNPGPISTETYVINTTPVTPPVTPPAAVPVVTATRNAKTLTDALKALQAVSGLVALTADEKITLDVAPLAGNGTPAGNGKVDIADVIAILRRSVNIGSW